MPLWCCCCAVLSCRWKFTTPGWILPVLLVTDWNVIFECISGMCSAVKSRPKVSCKERICSFGCENSWDELHAHVTWEGHSLDMNPVESNWPTIGVDVNGCVTTADEGHSYKKIASRPCQRRTCIINYTCHAVVLVFHVGPVTWQLLLSFYLQSIPSCPFRNVKKVPMSP